MTNRLRKLLTSIDRALDATFGPEGPTDNELVDLETYFGEIIEEWDITRGPYLYEE